MFIYVNKIQFIFSFLYFILYRTESLKAYIIKYDRNEFVILLVSMISFKSFYTFFHKERVDTEHVITFKRTRVKNEVTDEYLSEVGQRKLTWVCHGKVLGIEYITWRMEDCGLKRLRSLCLISYRYLCVTCSLLTLRVIYQFSTKIFGGVLQNINLYIEDIMET